MRKNVEKLNNGLGAFVKDGFLLQTIKGETWVFRHIGEGREIVIPDYADRVKMSYDSEESYPMVEWIDFGSNVSQVYFLNYMCFPNLKGIFLHKSTQIEIKAFVHYDTSIYYDGDFSTWAKTRIMIGRLGLHSGSPGPVLFPDGHGDYSRDGQRFAPLKEASLSDEEAFYAGEKEKCQHFEHLERFTFPAHVERIGESFFAGCTALKSIRMPLACNEIGPWAFSDCQSLEEIAIPEGVTTIKGLTFRKCSHLKTVYLPKTIATVETDAFYGCDALTTVYYAGTKEEWKNLRLCRLLRQTHVIFADE